MVINEIALIDRFKPENTILIAMWYSNVPLNCQLLQHVYKKICCDLVELEREFNVYGVDYGRDIIVG